MALIEVQHVIPTQFPVNPNHDAVNNPIIEGQFVALDADGYVVGTGVPGDADIVATNTIGVAGESLASDKGYTPYAADIVVSSTSGRTRSTSNRVSDMFDETLGSGKMTVYISGGEFLTNVYAEAPTAPWTPGANAYCTNDGLLTTDDGSGRVVGVILSGPTAVESGVPGTDAGARGSISLGDYVRFKLSL